MTQLLITPESSVFDFEEPQFYEDADWKSTEELVLLNRKRAAAAYNFRDMVQIDVYKTTEKEMPGLQGDWEYAASLPAVVVTIQPRSGFDQTGLVAVITETRYPVDSVYSNVGPRLMDPIIPGVEQLEKGNGWLLYSLRRLESDET